MIEMGLTPSSITYGILIKGYGLEKKFDGVMYMYDKMCENNIRLNDVTYGCLIDACIKCDKPEKALQFFKMLQDEPDMKINAVIYSLLIKGFTSNRNFEKAYEVFQIMVNDKNLS